MRYYLQDEYNTNFCGCPDPEILSSSETLLPSKIQYEKPEPIRQVMSPEKAPILKSTTVSTNYTLPAKPSFFKQIQWGPLDCKPPWHKNRAVPQYKQARDRDVLLYRGPVLTSSPPRTEFKSYASGSRSSGRHVDPHVIPDGGNRKIPDAICYTWLSSVARKQHQQPETSGGRSFSHSSSYKNFYTKPSTPRFALSYPDAGYSPSGFVPHCRPQAPVQEEYPEKLIKEEVYENQYRAPRQAYFFASPSKDTKQEKKWSFVKTLNNALKTITTKEKRSPDDTPHLCDCGENLNICGPEYKKCGGIEGVLIPCGFNCDCRNTKQCMEGYVHSLCPCDKPCRCPRMTDQRPLQQDYGRSLGRSGQAYVDPELRQKQPVRANVNYQAPEIHHGFSDTAVVKKAKAEKDYGSDDRRRPGDGTKSLAHSVTEDSVKIKYMPHKHISDSEDCCCSCDEEPCNCICCNDLAITRKGVQTSRFCFRENCTQTDRSRKKCCRCCRCRKIHGKKNCQNCTMAADEQKNDTNGNCGNNVGGYDGLYQRDVIQLDNGYQSGYTGYVDRSNCCDTGTPQDNMTCCNKTTKQMETRTAKRSKIVTRSTPTRGKTLMVRTNSIQCCIPTQENKSTNCDYADTISASRIDRFIAELYGKDNESVPDPFRIRADISGVPCKHGGDFQESKYALNAEDINKLTKAKLQNYFLDGDVYLSPVSGKNYDLSYRNVDIPTKIPSTKLLKPLDVNEQLTQSQISAHCFTNEGEHVKLMTSICEAILSTNQNAEMIETPTKEVKETPPLKEQENPVLHTITEDNESSNSSKNNMVVDTVTTDVREEPQSLQMNQKLIDEIQQSFKDKIDKLEERIDKLIHNNEPKPKLTPKTRSQSPVLSPPLNKQKTKSKPEHKPLVTKTGLFGVLPTRSQVLNGYNPKTRIDNQQGDAKSEPLAKPEDESIMRYETLLEGNQKHVDNLLLQLEVLHNHNTMLDESNDVEIKPKDVCCLVNTGNVAYKPDLGTGENFTALDEILKLSSPNKLYNKLTNLFPGDERGERVFCLNDIEFYNQGPSTSASRKETTKQVEKILEEPRSPLDFSNVVFSKPPSVDNKDVPLTSVASNPLFSLSSPNFILDNLQSYTTSISDSLTVEQLLNKDDSGSFSTVESLFAKNDGCNDDSNTSVRNIDLNCKNKV